MRNPCPLILCALLIAAPAARADTFAERAEKAMTSNPNGRLREPSPSGAAADRLTVRLKGGRSVDLDVTQLASSGPLLVTSPEGRYYVTRATLLDDVSPESRAAILATLQARLAGRLGDLAALQNVGSFLATALPADRARLEAAVPAAAPDVGAALLLALCEQTGQDSEPAMACFDAKRGSADAALAALVARAATVIDPARPRAQTVRCTESLLLLRDVGGSARSALPLLASLMQADAAVLGSVGCGREEVAATAALVALQLPQQGTVADIAAQAVQTFVAARLAFAEGRGQGVVVPTRLTALLDAMPFDEAMRTRLDALALAQWARCAPLRPESLNDLGVMALGLATAILDHWSDTGCATEVWTQNLARASQTPAGVESGVGGLIETQLQRFPDSAAFAYGRATTVFARDHFIEATLAAMEALAPAASVRSGADGRAVVARRRAALRQFLAGIGYVAVVFGRDGAPRFPRSSGLRWQPLAEPTLAVPAPPGEPAVDLVASLQAVSRANPTCRWPVPADTALARARSAKTLFVLDCVAASSRLIVIGSARGFRPMYLPIRLVGEDASGNDLGWELVAVSDVDGDGRFEIVTRHRNCSGKYCTGTDADVDHDFSQEDGDRFTYFLRRAITPAR